MNVFAVAIWTLSFVFITAFTEVLARWFFRRRELRLLEIIERPLPGFFFYSVRSPRSEKPQWEPERWERWERERRERERRERLRETTVAQQRIRMFEFRIAMWLALLSGIAYLVSYLALKPVLADVQHSRFGPSEAAQIITAVGGAGLAIGTAVAAIIKAFALLLHARADVIRARLAIPPDDKKEIEAP